MGYTKSTHLFIGWRWDDSELEHYLQASRFDDLITEMREGQVDQEFRILCGEGSKNYVGIEIASEKETGGDNPVDVDLSKVINAWRLLRAKIAETFNIDSNSLPAVKVFLVSLWN